MSRFIIVALLVAVAIAACSANTAEDVKKATEKCSKLPNKIWSPLDQCGRVKCSQSDPQPCLPKQGGDCVCKQGYLELDNGDCVPKEKCPK